MFICGFLNVSKYQIIEMKFDGTYQSQVSEIKCSRHKHLYRPFHCIYNATNIVLTLIKNENGIEGKKQSKRSKVSVENKFNIQC